MALCSELDEDVSIEIARKIESYEDFVAFCGVCSLWRSAEIAKNFIHKWSLKVPWLLLPPKKCINHRDFFDFSKGRTLQMTLPTQVDGKKYFSSKGWLITIGQDLSMSLVHPFSRDEITLPHLKNFDHWRCVPTPKLYANFISKCVLSADPLLTSEYTLMVIYGDLGVLAFYKPGNKYWTTIYTWKCPFDDVTYYDGKFYGVTCNGHIMVCDIEGCGDDPVIVWKRCYDKDIWTCRSNIKENMIHQAYVHCHGGYVGGKWKNGCRHRGNIAVAREVVAHSDTRADEFYIVESGGELLVVSRDGGFDNNTTSFEVSKMDLIKKTCTEIDTLGNRAIFLGLNSSFSVDALDNPGCKPNCIYFTDRQSDGYWYLPGGGGRDIGVYNVKDGTIEPLPHYSANFLNRLNPPMWVQKSY